MNALFDAHRDDPEFGYRFLLDEAGDAGQVMTERTAWRICADNGWWSCSLPKSQTTMEETSVSIGTPVVLVRGSVQDQCARENGHG